MMFFGVHANCPNFVPLKRKKREIKEKETKKGGYDNITNKKEKGKKEMREGVDCIAAVTDRHAESVLIKGLRLQRQRAQGPALLPPKLQKTSKRRERDYTASCGACRKPNTRVRDKRERGKKRF